MQDEKNVRVNFIVDRDTHDKLKAIADKDDRSVSSVIRILINEAIENGNK